jgi:transaldolase
MSGAGVVLTLFGQSLWLDNIHAEALRRRALRDGTHLQPDDLREGDRDQRRLRHRDPKKRKDGRTAEALFFELALEDLTRAADLFRTIHERTNSVDGWVSLQVSPLLAHDTATTLAEAECLHARAGRSNLFIKIPGTREGVPAIEEAIFAGVPINVTLIFSREHYLAGGEAFLRGIERRVAAGLDFHVAWVASLFVSRWDAAVASQVPDALRNQLGITIASGSTRPTGAFWARPVGSASTTWAAARSACSSPAPAPRIRGRRTSSTSIRSPRPSP